MSHWRIDTMRHDELVERAVAKLTERASGPCITRIHDAWYYIFDGVATRVDHCDVIGCDEYGLYPADILRVITSKFTPIGEFLEDKFTDNEAKLAVKDLALKTFDPNLIGDAKALVTQLKEFGQALIDLGEKYEDVVDLTLENVITEIVTDLLLAHGNFEVDRTGHDSYKLSYSNNFRTYVNVIEFQGEFIDYDFIEKFVKIIK